MKRRIFSFILCFVVLMSCIPLSANAEKIAYYQVQIDAGNGVKTEKAIIENDEIYILATSFSNYTRFEFNTESQTFLVKGQEADKAFKKVIVNAETKKVAVGTELIELSNSFVIDGEIYLPLCQMLPILNSDIIGVDAGIVFVVNNKLSMAELLYDFDINDYCFNISEEFFGNEWMLFAYMFPSYLFDTVVNCRFDRLDVLFDSGTCEDYQTIFTGYMRDDELFHKARAEKDVAGELLESITGLTGISKTFHDVYDWAEEIAELKIEDDLQEFLEFEELEVFVKKGYAEGAFDDELREMLDSVHDNMTTNDILNDVIPGGLSFANALEAVDYIFSLLNQVDDHREMLDAVYNISDSRLETNPVSGASSPYFAHDLEHMAAGEVYELYSGEIIPEYTKKVMEEIAERLFEERTIYDAFNVYKLTAGIAGGIIELYCPGDSGDRALLPLHANIVNSAMRKSAVPTLDTAESTDAYRLSLLLTMLSSRACYKIMAETASGYGQDDTYYRQKISRIEDMIMSLYLVASNVGFDTYENFSAFCEDNREKIKDYLQLLISNTQDKPSDPVQTWTITKRNSGYFSPYQETTYTVEWKSGQVYTLLPEWKDGEDVGYGIIEYEVDTQKRTIMILMDYPEGCENWESLVIDLVNNTYYGQGFTVYGEDVPNAESSGFSKYIGRDISDVVNELGSNYIDIYLDGGRCYGFTDYNVYFFFENPDSTETTVFFVLSYGNADLGYGLSGNMTYSEIVEAMSAYDDVKLVVPTGQYNVMDDCYEYSLSFTLKGLNYTFSWSEDPETHQSYEAYVSY